MLINDGVLARVQETLVWKAPDVDGLIEFLVKDNGFR